MKFSCERCGKKYATAEEPAPGRVYKLRCKACGNLILVKAGANPLAAPPASVEPRRRSEEPARRSTPGAPAAAAHPAATSSADLDPLPPRAPAPVELSLDLSIDAPGEARLERGAGSGAARGIGPGTAGAPPNAAAGSADAASPRGGDAYIDLFGDGANEEEGDSGSASDDPFLALARSSLPDGFGQGASPSRLDAYAAPPAPENATPRHRIPDLVSPATREAERRSGFLPVALIALGAVVLAGVLAFTMMRGGPKRRASQPVQRSTLAEAGRVEGPSAAAPHTAPQQPPAAAAPAAPPQPATAPPSPPAPATPPPEAATPPAAASQPAGARPEPVRASEPPRAEAPRPARPAIAPEPPRRSPEKPVARREGTPDRKVERRPAPRGRPEARSDEAAAAASPPPAPEKPAPEPSGASLDEGTINRVIAANRNAFESCVAAARSDPEVKLDGRSVALRLTVNPSGFVTFPTIDDAALNATELGACLKNAARVLVFPKYAGDPVHAEVPLVLKP